MPKLKIAQEQILADIKAGKSFVNVVPDNIGEILYFDTNTPTDVPKSDFVYMLRKVAVFLLTAAVIAGIWYALDSVVWRSIWTALVVLIGCAVFAVQSYHGIDYFVGTHGYAEYTFNGSRDNITNKVVHTFDESDLLVHGETRNFMNGVYTGTSYDFAFLYSDPSGVMKKLHGLSSQYNHKNGGPNTGNMNYDFWYTVEQCYTRHILGKYLKLMESEGQVTFPIVTKSSIINETYVLSPDLHISPGVVKYKEWVFKKGGSSVPVVNNGVLSFVVPREKLFLSDETVALEEIPLEKIVNRDAFLFLLSKFF